jgi:hypothetical protein
MEQMTDIWIGPEALQGMVEDSGQPEEDVKRELEAWANEESVDIHWEEFGK